MQNGFLKGLKPKLIKQMALLMSICYLVSPLEQQITMVLHEVFHGLEMPSSALSHHTYEHVHLQDEHENNYVKHEHPFIDLVNSVLDASNENKESDKVPFKKVKLKKHITSDILLLQERSKKIFASEFYMPKMEINTGHPKELDAPPKSSLL